MERGLNIFEEEVDSGFLEYFIKYRGVQRMCVKSFFVN